MPTPTILNKRKIGVRALELARDIIKAEIKNAGYKVSHYSRAEINKAAKALVEGAPEITAKAKSQVLSEIK